MLKIEYFICIIVLTKDNMEQKTSEILFYSRINERTKCTYRICKHNINYLPYDNTLLQDIAKYKINIDEYLHMFDHPKNSVDLYYHIVICGMDAYSNKLFKKESIFSNTSSIKNQCLKIVDNDGCSFTIENTMQVDIFILRRVQLHNCTKYPSYVNCVLTRLFSRYEYRRSIFKSIIGKRSYNIVDDVNELYLLSLNQLDKYRRDIYDMDDFFKKINNELYLENAPENIAKQIFLLPFDSTEVKSIVVVSVKIWKDKGVLGKKYNRTGIKFSCLNEPDIIIYSNDDYICEIFLFRTIFTRIFTKKILKGVNNVNWRKK